METSDLLRRRLSTIVDRSRQLVMASIIAGSAIGAWWLWVLTKMPVLLVVLEVLLAAVTARVVLHARAVQRAAVRAGASDEDARAFLTEYAGRALGRVRRVRWASATMAMVCGLAIGIVRPRGDGVFWSGTVLITGLLLWASLRAHLALRRLARRARSPVSSARR